MGALRKPGPIWKNIKFDPKRIMETNSRWYKDISIRKEEERVVGAGGRRRREEGVEEGREGRRCGGREGRERRKETEKERRRASR